MKKCILPTVDSMSFAFIFLQITYKTLSKHRNMRKFQSFHPLFTLWFEFNGSLPTCSIDTQYHLIEVVRYRLKYATLILHLLLINVNVSFYP